MFKIVGLFLIPFLALAETCPTGDLKACQDLLKSLHGKNDDSFIPKYNEICNTNSKFSCVKVVVRGDVTEELKYQTEKRGPKAALFTVKYDGDNYIYILTAKPAPK